MAPAALAQYSTTVTVDPVQIGEDGTGTVVVNLDTDVTDYNAFEMNIYLPEGFTIENEKEGDNVYYTFTFSNRAPSHQITANATASYTRIVGCSLQNRTIKAGTGKLFEFNIIAPEGFAAEAEGSLQKIGFASGNTPTTAVMHWLPDATFAVMPYDGGTSGVEDVAVETDGEEVIYNLQGIRMERPLAPGIYIINGTKTRVR